MSQYWVTQGAQDIEPMHAGLAFGDRDQTVQARYLGKQGGGDAPAGNREPRVGIAVDQIAEQAGADDHIAEVRQTAEQDLHGSGA